MRYEPRYEPREALLWILGAICIVMLPICTTGCGALPPQEYFQYDYTTERGIGVVVEQDAHDWNPRDIDLSLEALEAQIGGIHSTISLVLTRVPIDCSGTTAVGCHHLVREGRSHIRVVTGTCVASSALIHEFAHSWAHQEWGHGDADHEDEALWGAVQDAKCWAQVLCGYHAPDCGGEMPPWAGGAR